jgi:hypothetical protein
VRCGRSGPAVSGSLVEWTQAYVFGLICTLPHDHAYARAVVDSIDVLQVGGVSQVRQDERPYATEGPTSPAPCFETKRLHRYRPVQARKMPGFRACRSSLSDKLGVGLVSDRSATAAATESTGRST